VIEQVFEENGHMTVSLETANADPTARLLACLDGLLGYDVGDIGDARLEALLAALGRAEACISSLRLQVLARAERSRTAYRQGVASTGAWAARIERTDPATAQRQVGLAQGLERRGAARAALGAGRISAEHAAVIVHADRQLPPRVTPQQRDSVEAALVEKAQSLSPTALRRAARRALAAVESDVSVVDAHEDAVVRAEEDRARTRTRLSLHDNGDGTVSGHFTVPTLHGELLRKVLEAMTAPRRGRLGAAVAQVGDRDDRTDWDRARGQAFCELLEHLPTDHLHPRTAATVVVAITEEVLRGALRVAGLDTGGVLSAGEARRIACGAGLLPAVLGRTGRVLDLGRSARLFSEAQRIALGVHHQTCAADGCERPFAWCELHHRRPWSHGGSTDLDQAVPLCHFHHQRIHDPRFGHSSVDRGIRFHPRT
jgi:hypothetical protein